MEWGDASHHPPLVYWPTQQHVGYGHASGGNDCLVVDGIGFRGGGRARGERAGGLRRRQAASTVEALVITARFSFLSLWLAYASGGLALLIGPATDFLRPPWPRFRPRLRRRSPGAYQPGRLALLDRRHTGEVAVRIFFVPPLVVVYVLALFSIPTLAQRLGRTL